MRNKLIFIVLIFTTSCSTLNKSVIYPALAGAVIGGLIGKELSPDKESDKINLALGSAIGTAIGGGTGYLFYNSANPDLNLNNSPLEDIKIEPITESGYTNDKFVILPTLIPVGEKQYIGVPSDLPDDIKATTKKQYFKKYQVQNYMFEKDGKNYKVPDFEIIETGVE